MPRFQILTVCASAGITAEGVYAKLCLIIYMCWKGLVLTRLAKIPV